MCGYMHVKTLHVHVEKMCTVVIGLLKTKTIFAVDHGHFPFKSDSSRSLRLPEGCHTVSDHSSISRKLTSPLAS